MTPWICCLCPATLPLGEAPGRIRRLSEGQPFVLVQRPKAEIPHPTSEGVHFHSCWWLCRIGEELISKPLSKLNCHWIWGREPRGRTGITVITSTDPSVKTCVLSLQSWALQVRSPGSKRVTLSPGNIVRVPLSYGSHLVGPLGR